MPNVEWVLPQDESEIHIRKPDVVLYKNAFSQEMCERIDGFNEVPVRAVTGWTSTDFRTDAPPAGPVKDFRRFQHVKGMSDQKQTSLVLGAWLANPDFPKLTIIATMHDGFRIPVTLKASENVEIIFRKIPMGELRTYQEACGVHVYPSNLEGFGHSLNEARVCESVLVTTDGHPMSGFVTHRETGFLVPVEQSDIQTVRRSRGYEIRQSALEHTIRHVLSHSPSELARIGRRSRQAYLTDRDAFNTRIADVFGKRGRVPIARGAIKAA